MFGSEFIAMKTAVEMLRMMGIEIDGSMNVFCGNESVVMNSMRPESML